MAERSIAAVLKTVEGQTSGGSNPSLSAKQRMTPQCGAFLLAAEPGLPGRREQTKKTVSEANGHSWFEVPLNGITAGNPSLSANKCPAIAGIFALRTCQAYLSRPEKQK